MFNPLAQSLNLNQAVHRAQQARLVLEEEKADSSLWTRLKDSLTQTKAETENEDAQVALSLCENEIAEQAPAWVETKILERIAATHTPETRELMGILPTLNQTRSRLAKLKVLTNLSKTAVEELRDAMVVCDQAASGELMDVMSTVRPSKALQDNEMEEAKYAIHRAHSALVRLGSGVDGARVEGIDDADTGWWNQTLDFEITSLTGLNLSALEHAKETCKTTLPKVEEVRARLEDAFNRQHQHLEKIKQSYAALEDPFRQDVLKQLPENILALLTRRGMCLKTPSEEVELLSSTGTVSVDPPKGRLDFDVVRKAREG